MHIALAAHTIAVVAAGFCLSVRSILRGQYEPQRATWLGWLVMDLVLVYSSYQIGGLFDPTFVLGSIYTAGALIVFLLSIKYGQGGTSPFDIACLVLGITGAITSYFFGQTGTAIVLMCFALWVSALPNLKAAWKKPQKEYTLLWWLFVFGADYSILQVTNWHKWESWLFPAVDIIFMFAMLGTIYLAHWRIRRKAEERL